MDDREHGRRTDIGLRLCGVLSGSFSALAAWKLAALHLSESHSDPGGYALFLAAAAFLGASLGAVLLTQGRHIFDRIELGERWRRRLPAEPVTEMNRYPARGAAASSMPAGAAPTPGEGPTG